MSMLELQGVTKVYGQGATVVNALSGVHLSVEPGAMVAVMGPSGSGKSTLLTIAGSLEEPTEGEVLIDGAPLSRMSRNARARLRRRSIGYVFQDFNLLPGLTAVENVALPLELDGISGRRARAAGKRALDDLGLAERADTGAVLGTVGGYVGTAGWFSANEFNGGLGALFTTVPVTNLLIILVGMPLVAAIGGWIFAGRQPRDLGHQPLE